MISPVGFIQRLGSRSVRLSAQPEPTPLVPLWCESCAVGWKGRPGDACWNCGHPA